MDALKKWCYLSLSFLIAFLTFVVIGTSINIAVPRVNYGDKGPSNKYPYMVTLRNDNCEHFCGGSIIHKRWILTTARCLKSYEHDSVDVIVGTDIIPVEEEQNYQSEYIKIHEHLDDPKLSNDIGLIRVNKDINFTDSVQLIPLTTKNFKRACYRVIAVGWNRTQDEDPDFHSAELLEIKQRSVGQHVCKRKFATKYEINTSHICTLQKNGNSICHFEPGGPLVADGVQIGIATVIPCADGTLDIYTRVYTYLDWIKNEQKKYGD